jgi:glycosyltransferase involved in cell wall biosynthesis
LSTSRTVSIIICTRNRADSLRETLESVGRVRVPEDMPAELLVVDNGSTDHTKEVVEQADLHNMPVRYVFEPQKGLSNARNRGIAESTGDILLWTDDDVRVPEDWIEGMCRPILNGEADAVAGGVRLAPELEREWMGEKDRGLFGELVRLEDYRENAGFLIGANMAFGRHVLAKVPQFDPFLGAGALGFMEETLFALQLEEAGFRILPKVSFAVEHNFDPERLLRKSYLKSVIAHARSTAHVAYHWDHQEPSLRHVYRTARHLVILGLFRILFPWQWLRKEGVADWEARHTLGLAINAFLLCERGKTRRYARRALTPFPAEQQASPE